MACICISVNVFIDTVTKHWRPAIGDAEPTLYLSIARALALDVARGRLKPGDQLPPQRELADTLGVALGTVTRAYSEAERRGLVRGQGRRGTVVSGGPPRPGLSSLVDAGGPIDLAANYPAPSLDPDLGAALKRVARRSDIGELLRYPPSAGLLRHREALAAWLREQGVPAGADDLVMTAGAQHGIWVAMAAIARAGDEVACESLTFPGVRSVADSLGVKLLPVALDEHGLLPDAFEQLCRGRAVRGLYTIPSLHNPTSACLTAERRRDVARIAEAYDVLLIEDDLHRPLVAAPPAPLAALAPERTLFVSSASKSIAGGLRVGCVLAPRRLRDAVVQAVQASTIACPALNAEILAGWLEDGTARDTIAARVREARARQQQARRSLGDTGCRLLSRPESYCVWLELPEVWHRDRLAQEAQRRGVAVAPADLFAVDVRRTPNAVRLALSAPPSRQTLAHGLSILAELLAGLPPRGTATL